MTSVKAVRQTDPLHDTIRSVSIVEYDKHLDGDQITGWHCLSGLYSSSKYLSLSQNNEY